MNTSQIRKILKTANFVSGITGSGKTRAFIKKCLKNVKRIYIYAAPNKELMAETYANLKSKVGPDRNIYVIHSDFAKMKFAIEQTGTKSPFIYSRPANTINALMGGKPTKYSNSDSTEKIIRKAQIGDIIICTHDAINKVNTECLKDSSLFFDEASVQVECIEIKSLNSDQWKKFIDNYAIEKDGEKGIYRLHSLTSLLQLKKLLYGNVDKRYMDEGLVKVHNIFKTQCVSGRFELILEVKNENDEFISGKAHAIIQPADVFKAFEELTILSACFENTLMYHSLKHSEFYELRNAISDYPEIEANHKKIIRNVRKRARCVYLIDDTDTHGNKVRDDLRGLTGYRLGNDMLITKKYQESAKFNFPFRKDEVIQRAAMQGYDLDGVPDNVFNDMKQCALPPAFRLLEAANHAYECYGPNDGSKMLTVFNVDNSKKSWFGTQYLNLIHDGADYKFQKAARTGEVEGQGFVPDRYLNKISKMIYERGDGNISIAKTPKMNGVNKYNKLNSFCYLASMYQGEDYKNMYETLYPDYNAFKDTVIENIVQTMFRVSLRTADANEDVLVVLPYKSMFEQVARAIDPDGKWQFEYEREAYFKWFGHQKQMTSEERQEQTAAATEASVEARRVWDEEFKKTEHFKKNYNKLRTYRKRYKAAGNVSKLEKLEKLLDDLKLQNDDFVYEREKKAYAGTDNLTTRDMKARIDKALAAEQLKKSGASDLSFITKAKNW